MISQLSGWFKMGSRILSHRLLGTAPWRTCRPCHGIKGGASVIASMYYSPIILGMVVQYRAAPASCLAAEQKPRITSPPLLAPETMLDLLFMPSSILKFQSNHLRHSCRYHQAAVAQDRPVGSLPLWHQGRSAPRIFVASPAALWAIQLATRLLLLVEWTAAVGITRTGMIAVAPASIGLDRRVGCSRAQSPRQLAWIIRHRLEVSQASAWIWWWAPIPQCTPMCLHSAALAQQRSNSC
mmetsp:Transcript_38297/g.97817  ORF Transcript_38297/g.97817 Transcript_38297/m.97817 type:complete len:239 (+) Transcript_38297:168-884(+)